jgi:hypothetical protein
MARKIPKYALHFRWGNFQLNIVGKRTILCWAALAGLIFGLTHISSKLFDHF